MAITDDNSDGWKLKKMDSLSDSCWWQKKGGNGSVGTIRTPNLFGDDTYYSVQDKNGTVVNGSVSANSDDLGLYNASKKVDKHLPKKRGWFW